MKRLLICISLFILFFSVNSYAQHISLGGGIPYNFTAETPGLNLRGYYNMGEHFCFGPELTFFLPKTEIHDMEEIETTIWEINVNAHYIFEVSEHLGIYPIIGLNYTREKEDISYLLTGETEEKMVDAVGMNIGGGFHLPLPHFVPFVEYEYVVGDLSEHILTVGIFFSIGEENESEEKERE